MSEASRISASPPRSCSVAGVPKISVIALAAVGPTAWSCARRIRKAASTSSAFARDGTQTSGILFLPDFGMDWTCRGLGFPMGELADADGDELRGRAGGVGVGQGVSRLLLVIV